MKTRLSVIFAFLLLSIYMQGQVLRPFTSRYFNGSVKGSIVYVSNSIVSAAGVGPGVPGTGELAPSGTSENGSSMMAINIDVDNTVTTNKLPYSSVWSYHARNAAPPNDGSGRTWIDPAYVLTSNWNIGASPVNGTGKYGYNSSQTTCIPSGQTPICTPGASSSKYTAAYFRRTVSFTAAELSTTFNVIQLNMFRNDGIVVYINGVERIRNNMPNGAVTYATLASSNITPGPSESIVYNLSPSFFIAGTNTIAVEVHLRSATSADMLFDMEVLGIHNNGTFNSSTSNLNLPSCSNVLFAGLYWGTGQGASGSNTSWIAGENTCKFKVPGAANYTSVTSSQTDYWNNTLLAGFTHTGYQCFANVTSLINTTNPNGTYTVADVVSPAGIGNGYGGWTLVIAYANPTLPTQNLSVFDGCASIKNGAAGVDVPITGFLTPPTGPVSCELGAVVYDGDRNSPDSFSFKQNGALSYYSLATTAVPFNSNTEAWNSKITYKSTNITTRNPAFNNTLGYDASIFDLPNTSNLRLSNNQTSATVRFSSSSENYIVQLVSTSISQFNPAYAFSKTATDINGGLLVPGDSIRYQVDFQNTGNDSSTNTIIYDNIPLGSTYIPNSLKINGVARTDASGDDQAEFDFANNRVILRIGLGANASNGGSIGPSVTGSVQFDVATSGSCDILSCVGSLQNVARVNYYGKLSGNVLYDSSGVNSSGCIVPGPVITPVSGSCFSPKDTILVIQCPANGLFLPRIRFAGYTFFSAIPFTPANMYNPDTQVTSSGIYWAYFNNGNGCSDTARIQIIKSQCPDIDDDDDGIPDYVEFDDPLALVMVSGLPNWNRPSYPGYVDHNGDGVNDLFDWGADADNDGIPNFHDNDFWKPWVDVNNDGVNDLSDKDLDGIPNQFDLESDNDGIPDVVEAYGVDINGDGKIDDYADTDNDGLSQNVDGSNTGVYGSGNGLGAPDFDDDGIPNYLDTDSDNDGIPDIIEAGGADSQNRGKVNGFVDMNGDGLDDNYFMATALLKTGPDVGPVDGRADNYPNKNKDQDFRPNAYDLDSDGDGIVDVIEAGLPDANFDGRVDGTIGSNGWSTIVSSLITLSIRNSDTDPYPDYLDIDSDDDGIPDNIEGQSTANYKLPTTADTDGDGIANVYDNIVGFGGSGIYVYDHDGDNLPDYRDNDSDGDGLSDRVEGNDFNLNSHADDNVTLTGLDDDGDGLDNRFDSLNSVINIKGTSYRMGTNGSFTGDAAPGSRTPAQRTNATQTDRDWRFSSYVLPVQFLNFTGTQYKNDILLNWTIFADKEVDRFEIERSLNQNSFTKALTVSEKVLLQVQQRFSALDDVNSINSAVIYYRLKVIGKDGTFKYSPVIAAKRTMVKVNITVKPNPATTNATVVFYAEKAGVVNMRLIDKLGQTVFTLKKKMVSGVNTIQLESLDRYSNGVYTMQLVINDEITELPIVIWN